MPEIYPEHFLLFYLLINKSTVKKISLQCNINLSRFSALLYAHCDLCGLLLVIRRVCFAFQSDKDFPLFVEKHRKQNVECVWKGN